MTKRKVEVEIPDGEYCQSCPFLFTQWGGMFSESHSSYCKLFKKNLNQEMYYDEEVRAFKSCRYKECKNWKE